MNIHMIWAQDTNSAIGSNGTLPWHFSEDLKNFKKLTIGNIIIMGRKTWDSLPTKPLPNRRNIVISSTKQQDAESYTSIEECISVLKKDQRASDIYIIGGRSVYKFFYEYANILHVTFINKTYPDTDTFFPVSINTIKTDFNLESKDEIIEDLIFTRWTRK